MFHILDTVAMPRGAVLTGSGKPDITTYSCCMSAQQGVYYFKTYENSRIRAVRIDAENPDAENLRTFSLHPDQDILFLNQSLPVGKN